MKIIVRAMIAATAIAVSPGSALAATTIAASPAPAVATTITFDDLPEGAVVSNQYAGLGVEFVANAFTGAGSSSSGASWATNTGMRVSATDVGDLGSPSLVGGNVLHAYGNDYYDGVWLDENGDPSFFMNFSSAISSISVTFAGVSTPSDARLFIYNGATLLATIAGTGTSGQFALGYAAPSITRVGVAPGSFNDWVGIDNIVFQPVAAAVPEPATWAMMILGMGAVGFSLRRRKGRAAQACTS